MNLPEAPPKDCPPVYGTVPTGPRPARFAPLWLSGGFVGLVAAVHWAQRWELPFPQCLMRKFTGVPCPTCGCTRSLLAWWELDLAAAFRFNPLFFVLCLGLLAWFGLWCFERLTGRAWLARWRAQVRHRWVWKVCIGLAVLNWLYLWHTLPQ